MARIAAGASTGSKAANSSPLATVSSTIASTTNVASARRSGSQVTSTAPFRRAPARCADAVERAHRTTGPWAAATAARPHAMVPLPTMPTRSGMFG